MWHHVIHVLACALSLVLVAGLVFWICKCFTLTQESTAKAVVRFKSYRRMLFSKQGFVLNKDGVLTANPAHRRPFGGLQFIGIWPIDQVYKYDWKWVKVGQGGDGQSVLEPRHDENVDYIRVGQIYVYGLNMKGKDVVDRDLLPIESSLALSAMIVCPRKALFDTKDWFNTFISVVEPAVRSYINCHSYGDMIALSHLDLGKDVFADLVLKGVIAKLENDYGIRLTAVECKGIRLEGEYQDNATEQWRAQQDANRDMTKRTGSTTGALMAMLASMTKAKGQTLDQRLEEVQAEFRASPEGALKKYEGLIKLNSPFIEQQIASDSTSPSLRRFYFQGGSGGLDIMAMLGEALRGNGGNPAPQPAPAPRQGNRQPATPPASPPVATAPTKTDAQLAQDFANDNGGQYPAWDPLKRKPVYKE